MSSDFFQIDAFTGEPFRGNPAAVCLLSAPREEEWMQAMAAEMNLSETAFVVPQQDRFAIRWFTPKLEVDLCGHATLASAHALWEVGAVGSGEEIELESRSGVLRARRERPWIELDFPARGEQRTEPPATLIEGLGAMPGYVARSEEGDLLVELESSEVVRDLQPDIELLGQVEARGIIVTARSDDEAYDFVSRFFAPQSGIAEDPVTGSAHCCLGPYWGKRLRRDEMMACQASERGGVVRVRLAGERVLLGGQAVTVVEGRLRV